MSLQYLSDAIAIHMDAWETTHSDHTLDEWYSEKSRFTEQVAISLWHDCQSDALRKIAIYEAN